VRRTLAFLGCAGLLLGAACARRGCPAPCVPSGVPPADVRSQQAPRAEATAAAERDEIYSLAAMEVVRKDWQSEPQVSRGYNIGCVLVDPAGKIVAWGRNCNKVTGNGTQHGEVRLIQGFLARSRGYYLADHAVYTTLEPCAQCSGMMVLAKVSRTVYSQTDPDFGKALERLALDSRALPGGFGPYPRAVRSEHGKFAAAQELDHAFATQASRSDAKPLVDWLAGTEAKAIYDAARLRLADFSPRFPENRPVLEQARQFLGTVPDRYTPLFPWDPPRAGEPARN
jgi:tRNA(adenine34) deaminase